MDSNDLFSFLDDNTQEEPEVTANGHAEPMDAQSAPALRAETSLKRKVDDALLPTPPRPTDGDVTMSEVDDGRIPKKPRMGSPKPVVLDSVEIEAKREVAASAGLTGAAEAAGSRLELKHQVRTRAACCWSGVLICMLQVRHQVAVPPGYPYIPISQHVPPAKPAREYKFVLDPFQQVSVHAIQRNESVLVSAHTSAGKTVVAEYAIAQCLQNKQRVIYTSPIKVSRVPHIVKSRVLNYCAGFE